MRFSDKPGVTASLGTSMHAIAYTVHACLRFNLHAMSVCIL